MAGTYEPVDSKVSPGTDEVEKKDEKKQLYVNEELEKLLKNPYDAAALAHYLKKEMNLPNQVVYFTDEVEKKFADHEIGGYAFQELNEKHLDEMEITMNLGQKLHLLSIVEKVKKAFKIKDRNKQVFKSECTLYTGNFHYKGIVSLTNSSLKFKFEEQQEKTIDIAPKSCWWQMCCKFAKFTLSGTMRALDHVDISLIEDVDLRKVTITQTEETKNIYCPGLCFCQHSGPEETTKEANFVFISLAVPEEIYSAYMGGGEITTTLKVEIENKTQAAQFKERLVEVMEQVQFEVGSRYEGN